MNSIRKRSGITAAVLAVVALIMFFVMYLVPRAVVAGAADPAFGNYYMSDYDSRAEALTAGNELNAELYGEGTVLLKNEDNALPLRTEKKLSLFGKNLFAKMSGLPVSLRRAGFSVNNSLENFYKNVSLTGTGAPGHPGNGVNVNGMPTGEADISLFTDSASVAEFGDAAIVAFFRTAGEGYDMPRTMAQVNGDYKAFGQTVGPVAGARAADDHYLQLDANETKTLKYVCDHFEKVIVLINSPSAMELGFLDDSDHYAYSSKIKAALWVYALGQTKWDSITEILTGERNPSGRLPDIFPRDLKADPTWNNFGNNFLEDYRDGGNVVAAKGDQYDNLHYYSVGEGATLGAGGYYSNYVYYKEGIYSGYRYYETRGYTEGSDSWTGTTLDTLDHYAHGPDEAIHYYSGLTADKTRQDVLNGKVWPDWYKAHVVYPFGYGLSYTTFDWELISITDELTADGTVTAEVRVSNTGSVAGKDVVELYYSAPYTDGGIEKSHVKLGAFAKTDVLYPEGESGAGRPNSQTVTLEFKVRDMASYDYDDSNHNTFKGYELDAGTYTVYIGKNSHCWADHTALKKTYTLAAGIRYETDDATGNTVENRFDSVSEQLLHEDRYPDDDGDNSHDLYMSRSDFSGTYPTLSYRLTAEQWIIDALKEYNDIPDATIGRVYPDDKPTDPWYAGTAPTTGAVSETPVRLEELHGLDYDDPLWDTFLDQFTEAQLREFALVGYKNGYYSAGVEAPELGVHRVINDDTPSYILFRKAPSGTANVNLSDDVVTAATWNAELAYRRGRLLGNIAMWGYGSDVLNTMVTGWFAPAVNVHRNPFGGRNGEYFSEDGVLAGTLAARIVAGAQEKGLICYLKHFAVNSQESNRCGLISWANEQSMREIYFKPFELCVKDGGTLGIMSSLNRIGPRWAGGSYELLTGVLRNEWGFKGAVVTDTFGTWSNADCMIRAGGSIALSTGATLRGSNTSATAISCLRRSAHEILYAHAHSTAINTGETPTVPQKIRLFNAKDLDVGMINSEYEQSLADCIVLNTRYYPELTVSDLTFSLVPGSVLPTGLRLTPDGRITGTPKTESRLMVSIAVGIDDERLTQIFTINIIGESGIIIFSSTDKDMSAPVGKPFVGSVAKARIYDPFTEGELPDITYSLANGSVLPSGITMTADGRLSGTPTKECRNYSFAVVASAFGYADEQCTFTISLLYGMTYTTAKLGDARFGKSYIASVATAVCDDKVTYSLKEGSLLPTGLRLTPGGYITGIPEEAGAVTFTVVASAAFADSREATFTILVEPAFDPATELPYGKVNEEYFGSVGTAQGTFGITYSLVDGALPAGLMLDSDGTVMGTPTKAGTYTITVLAEDGLLSDEMTFTLYIANATAKKTSSKTNKTVVGLIVALAVENGVLVLAGAAIALVIVLKKRKRAPVGPGGPDGPGGDAPGDADKSIAAGTDAYIAGGADVAHSATARGPAVVTKPTRRRGGAKVKVKRRLPLPWFVVFAVLFVFIFVATMVLTQNMLVYNTVSSVLGGERRVLKSGNPADYMRYESTYDSKDDVYAAANELNERICEEGFVLLKNNDDVLPFVGAETKVTVFGKNSADIVLGGTGSNAGSSGSDKVDLSAVLDKGGKIKTNPVMREYLQSSASGSGRPAAPDMGVTLSGFPTGEAKLPYPQNVRDSYAGYNDAAIVVISRIGGEGYDLPRTMRYTGSKYTDFANATQVVDGARSGDDHYLQLDANETAMLAEACANFGNVIVLINSASPIELGFLDDPTHYAYHDNIKGAMWIGMPGTSGLDRLSALLCGEVSPSGRLVDTYSRDFKKDPTWFNFGNYLVADGNRYYTPDGAGLRQRKLAFVEYREGIYFGYRYYETRGLTAGDAWYNSNVVYPFGYGLSYTSFSHSVTAATPAGSALTADGKLRFTVDVTNTGTRAGKESVSLYFSAPYTDGGIEKAHVVLGDFGKTDTLAPDGTGTVTLEIDVRDMASYDYNDKNGNGKRGYELDAGDYTIYIGGDAHCWADPATPRFTYSVPSGGFSYDTSATGKTVKNLFDDVSGHITEYLSRKNDFANFDCLKGAELQSYRTVTDSFVADAIALPTDSDDKPWYTSVMPTQSARALSASETEVKLYDVIGLSYDDPLWDKLLDQLTVEQLVSLVRSGNFHSAYIESIDKPLTIDADGPMGFALFMGSDSVYKTCYYASECVLAATRNKALARDFGNMIGEEGLVGNEKGDGTPYSGWYAPAMNLHRSQFGGRNFEYYSEDACLSGLMAAEVVTGTSEKGVYSFMKHFALNDQETDRDTCNGLLTWANEQSMRETYFKPFERCVATGKATAVMSAFNRIGTVWAGGDYRLLTELLRGEWGFNGTVITDFNVNAYMDADQMIRAGGDLNLIGDKPPKSVSTPTGVAAVRRAAKNILYTVANSNAMNGVGKGVRWGYAMPYWEIWTIIVCVLFGAGTAALGVVTFLPYKKKQDEVEIVPSGAGCDAAPPHDGMTADEPEEDTAPPEPAPEPDPEPEPAHGNAEEPEEAKAAEGPEKAEATEIEKTEGSVSEKTEETKASEKPDEAQAAEAEQKKAPAKAPAKRRSGSGGGKKKQAKEKDNEG